MNHHSRHEHAEVGSDRRAPTRWSPLTFISAGFVGAGTLLAAADLVVRAPWYAPAAEAAETIVAAVVLRWSLERSRRPPCGAAHCLGGEPAFTCRRRTRHRGDHREGAVAWNDSGLYTLPAHRQGRRR